MLTVGDGVTVTEVLAIDTQPLASVTVTKYVTTTLYIVLLIQLTVGLAMVELFRPEVANQE